MPKLSLGIGAYKRTFSGAPEVQLVNRYVEKSPVNAQEGSSLLGRPGTTLLKRFDGDETITVTIATPAVVTWTTHGLLAGDTISFATTGALPTGMTAGVTYYVLAASLATSTFRFALTDGGTAINTSGSQSGVHTASHVGGTIRALYAKEGLFDGDLFVVAGHKFYRYASDGTTTRILGTIYNSGHPYVAWMKNIGYEYLFIADGLLLQYYNGGSHATGTLTVATSTPPNIDASQVVRIGNAYYAWHASDVNSNSPAGTSANPWLSLIGANDAASLQNLYNMVNFAGVPGTNFSSALPGPNLDYRATAITSTTVTFTATSSGTDGNAIATTVTGADLTWGASTMTGGGTHQLVTVVSPDGVSIKALAELSGYVLASVGGESKVFFIEPGEVTIDALNFFSKESSPDDVIDMLSVGDQTLIMGNGSTEPWYATGDIALPFLPAQGTAYARGVVEGTAVKVKDSVILVGDDLIVYEVRGGAAPISDSGIAERVRVQIRREQGLP